MGNIYKIHCFASAALNCPSDKDIYLIRVLLWQEIYKDL